MEIKKDQKFNKNKADDELKKNQNSSKNEEKNAVLTLLRKVF